MHVGQLQIYKHYAHKTARRAYNRQEICSAKGEAWVSEAKAELEKRANIAVEEAPENAEYPDLYHSARKVALECKSRSGKYPTTLEHVMDGIMPKFYEGHWITVTSRKGKKYQHFIPHTDAKGAFTLKPTFRYWRLYVLMDRIAAPDRAAKRLLDRLHIAIISLAEAVKILVGKARPKLGRVFQRPFYDMLYFYAKIYARILSGDRKGIFAQILSMKNVIYYILHKEFLDPPINPITPPDSIGVAKIRHIPIIYSRWD
jgi:hypothetical protein